MYSRVLTATIRAHLFPIQTTTPASTNVSRGIAASTGADINLPEHPSICSQKKYLEQDILHVLRSKSSCKLHECVHVRPPLTIFVFNSHEMSIEMNNLIDFNPRTKFWYLFSCHLYFIVKHIFSETVVYFQKSYPNTNGIFTCASIFEKLSSPSNHITPQNQLGPLGGI